MLKPVKLSLERLEALSLPVNGQGGHQTLLRRLQLGIDGDMLTVDTETLEKLIRHERDYGRGGFQSRIAGLADEIARANGLEWMLGTPDEAE